MLIFLITGLIQAHSQITVTNAVFPALGDTLFYAVDIQPGLSDLITAPGGDQNWDLSGLQPDQTWERIFKDPQTAAGSALFPAATLFYDAGGSAEAFLNVTGQEVALLGFNGGDPIGLGINLVSPFNPPMIQSRAPVNFFDIHQMSTSLLLPFSTDQLPAGFLNQLQISGFVDSLRIRTSINRLDAVDAWGTLSIPGGSFPVLREKRTQYRENRLDAKIAPLGWLDVTDLAIQNVGLNSLGVDTLTTHQFLNVESKEAIAILTLDNSGSQVVNIQYKNLGMITGSKDVDPAGMALSVFPNPTEGFIHIRAGNLKPGNYTLAIYNITGAEVWRKTVHVAGGQLDLELDATHLGNGAYLCRSSRDGEEMEGTRLAIFVKQ